jgi:hypothetical protein
MEAIANHLVYRQHVGGEQFLELFEGHGREKKAR